MGCPSDLIFRLAFVDCENAVPLRGPDDHLVVRALVLLGCLRSPALFLQGWRRARAAGSATARLGRLALFSAGLLAILVALVSPVDGLGDQLMVMHMLQHILLLDIAPILLILGLTKVLLRPVTRRLHAIERRAGYLAHPAFAVLAYAGLMWLLAHPGDVRRGASQRRRPRPRAPLLRASPAALYWWHLLSPIRSRMRLGGMGPIVYMVAPSCWSGSSGSRSPSPRARSIPSTPTTPTTGGFSRREDQSMAGLLMALEQSIVMGIALVVLFVQMLGESEREAQRAERYEVA